MLPTEMNQQKSQVCPDTALPLALDDLLMLHALPLQLEGLAHVLRQLGNYKATPDLEGPRYKVLRSTKEYEIRKYDPYLVAETAMPMSSGPAEGGPCVHEHFPFM